MYLRSSQTCEISCEHTRECLSLSGSALSSPSPKCTQGRAHASLVLLALLLRFFLLLFPSCKLVYRQHDYVAESSYDGYHVEDLQPPRNAMHLDAKQGRSFRAGSFVLEGGIKLLTLLICQVE